MKLPGTILLALLFMASFSAQAQTESTLSRPAKPTLKSSSSAPGIHAADRYNYQEKKIMRVLKSGTIPAGFPEFDHSTMTSEQYEATCKQWLKDHPALVKEEYLLKLNK